MQHRHSLTVQRDDHGNARIFRSDYGDDLRQVGETVEIAPGHPSHDAILTALDEEYTPKPEAPAVDTVALAAHIVEVVRAHDSLEQVVAVSRTRVKHILDLALVGAPYEHGVTKEERWEMDALGPDPRRDTD